MLRDLVVSTLLLGLAQAQFGTYLTKRPAQRSVLVDILNNTDPAQLDPGYIFVTPYQDGTAYQGGPQIFQNDGTLVYDGYELVEKEALDFHVCDYLGGLGNHLCFNDARPIQQGGHSSGVIRFFDNTYSQVGADFGANNGLIGPDIHELNTPTGYNGQIFLQIVYQTVPANLKAYSGPADGNVLSGCFQEIEIATKAVSFQWCSFDHVPLNQSYIPLNPPGISIAGTGTARAPYDYFHLNSVDKDAHGDYLISSRHCNAVYKIAGTNSRNTGSIIWYLGGLGNSFTFEGGFKFSWQHMARFQETSGTVTDISLFNNAYDGGGTPHAQTANASSGMIISVDTSNMTARLLQQFVQPEGLLATSQGAVSILPSGNRLVGWGSLPTWSEYDPLGNLLYYARTSSPAQSYRIWKFPFTAHPVTRPDILAYAHNCSSDLAVYLSWNGATEVKSWHLLGSTSHGGIYSSLGIYPKTGYETMVQLDTINFLPYVYAEALDHSGNLLNVALPVLTFVPNATLALTCNSTQCPVGTNYTVADSIASSCVTVNNITSTSTVPSSTIPSSIVVNSSISWSTHHTHHYHPHITHHPYHPPGYYSNTYGNHHRPTPLSDA